MEQNNISLEEEINTDIPKNQKKNKKKRKMKMKKKKKI